MSAARRARMPCAGVRVALALLCALGSAACTRPGQSGADTAPGQIDFTSPGAPPSWPGFGQDAPAPELTDGDVERIATRIDRMRVPRAGGDLPSKGPKHSPITLQVWSDFECPFCVQVAPTLVRIEQRYRGRIRLVWRNYPLPSHPRARPAARAALAAFDLGGSEQFWKFHDWLFSQEGDPSDDGLKSAAARLGLDATRIVRAAQSNVYDERIDRDVNAADLAGIEGTPSVLINDYHLLGARHEAEYAIVIERLLRQSGG
ncbi:MAG TPA: DsbA family protein [Polyangiaceae bacterium]|nr:DsbA family protein [Polyangiaceae bacterium]